MMMRDVMRPARWVIAQDATLGEAEHLMSRHRLDHVPVVDAGRLVGLLSERDVLAYYATLPEGVDWWRAPVDAAMEAAPLAHAPDDELDLAELAATMSEVIPVIEGGYLMGTVNAADALAADARTGMRRARAADATAADVMAAHPWTVRADDSLTDAAKLMVDYEVRHLPVVDKGELVGMLSDRDIRTIVGDPLRFVDSGDNALVVRDAMSPHRVTVQDDRPLREIATELVEDEIGAVPVVDAGGKLVGVISYVDVLRGLAA